jgi:hypothetical protein
MCEAPPMFELSGTPHQEEDWFETPAALADVCVAQVLELMEARPPTSMSMPYVHRILCPAAGRGIFPEALRRYYDDIDVTPHVVGCDVVDRQPRGLDAFTVCDARSWFPGVGPWDLAIDNIPFDVEIAVPIVQRYAETAAWCAFILPWAGFGGVDVWAPIFGGLQLNPIRPTYAFPITPRPWGDSVRETALFVWRRGVVPSHTKVRELPRWKP